MKHIINFFLPDQEVCVHVLSEQPDISYYEIQQAAVISRKMIVLAGEFGHFNILNRSEEDSYICRCAHCGRYFFSAGRPESCPSCGSGESPLTDFWLNGKNQHGVVF